MNKHTPGPWAILDRSENSRTLTHVTNGAHIICTLGTTQTDGSPNHSANASLIAAAPELYAALLSLLEDHHRMFPEAHPNSTIKWSACEEVKAACAAIAKAEGRAE